MKLIIDINESMFNAIKVNQYTGSKSDIEHLIYNGMPYEGISQGSWITHREGFLIWEECDQCNAQVGTIGMNFCPNCGAQMKK